MCWRWDYFLKTQFYWQLQGCCHYEVVILPDPPHVTPPPGRFGQAVARRELFGVQLVAMLCATK